MVHRAVELGDTHVYFFAFAQALASPPKGLVNAVVYGFTPLFFKSWREGLTQGKCMSCWRTSIFCCYCFGGAARSAASGGDAEQQHSSTGMVTLEEFELDDGGDGDANGEEGRGDEL